MKLHSFLVEVAIEESNLMVAFHHLLDRVFTLESILVVRYYGIIYLIPIWEPQVL